jgi:hypothetical protein
MKIEILPEAKADLDGGFWFYERQEAGLGEYFLSSVTSDIRSLQLFARIHPKYGDRLECLPQDFPIQYFIVLVKTSFAYMPLSTIDATRVG